MASIDYKTIAIYFIIMGIFAILVFFFVKLYIASRYEKRISKFSLNSPKENTESIIDIITSWRNDIIKKLSKILEKSDIMRRYSKRFEKFLIYEDNKSMTSMDYISDKFIIMITFQILYIISIIVTAVKFNPLSFMLLSIVTFFASDIIIRIIHNNRKKNIEDQLLQAIVIMNSAFKSGKNINDALDIVKNELPNPIKKEFEIVSKDMAYGLSLYEAFDRFSKRINVEEAKYMTASLSLLSKTGGNIVTVFNMIEKNIYNRMKIKNELKALTSSSKLLYRILSVLPFVFIALIVLMNPSYFTVMIKSQLGLILSGVIIIIYVIYLIIIRKVMKVEEV